MNATFVMVIYDGIENSVFAGQVVQPLIKYRSEYPNQPMVLIAFERQYKSIFAKTEDQLRAHNITLIILKKYPLITHIPLLLASRQLRNVLATMGNYELLARGPLAGSVCLRAYNTTKCTTLTIQARGLLTEEYAFSTRHITGLAQWYHRYKVRLFKDIETMVYTATKNSLLEIQAVSPALKNYLIDTYGTPASNITIAAHDIPIIIAPEQKKQWRTAIRSTLTIADTTHVYCYNGSAKAWQCPQETVAYFKERHTENPDSMLLILTQDVTVFKLLVEQYALPLTSYSIMHVEHTQIYTYLAASDTGIIMRDKNIINWTSRPTKILEYQAVGLVIAHNNTIGYLSADYKR